MGSGPASVHAAAAGGSLQRHRPADLQQSITVTQPIFRGGRTVASTRRAENQVLAQRARLLATEQQVMR